jgi:hypothetical protein
MRLRTAVYRAVVISTLLCGGECCTPYRRHVRQLEAFNVRCLQKILQLTWEDRVPHTGILHRARMTSVESILLRRTFRWVAHVVRMPESRLPKTVLFGELGNGVRPLGGQKKRFRDHLKRALTSCDMPPSDFEDLAADRVAWRSRCASRVKAFEVRRRQALEEKRRRRHDRRGDNYVLVASDCSDANEPKSSS